jgi:hypothetical protein
MDNFHFQPFDENESARIQNRDAAVEAWQLRLQEAQELLTTAQAESDGRFQVRLDAAKLHNGRVQEDILSLHQIYTDRAGQISSEIEEQKRNLRFAHLDAAASHSKAGVAYDRNAPDPEKPFRPKRDSIARVQRELGLETIPEKHHWLTSIALKLGAAILGIISGLSIGSKVGSIELSSKLLRGENLQSAIFWGAFGAVLMVTAGCGIYRSFRSAGSKRQHSDKNALYRRTLLMAGLFLITVVTIDSVLQATAYQEMAMSNSFSGELNYPFVIYLLAGAALSVTLLGTEAFVGYQAGLNLGAESVCTSEAARRVEVEEQRRRQESVLHRQASQDASVVIHIMNTIQELEQERVKLMAEHEHAVATKRGELIPEPNGWNAAENKIVLDAQSRLDAAREQLTKATLQRERGTSITSKDVRADLK